jgi:4-hydroxy-3-methylbut-2-en-1-yl diphosphate reductase
MTSALVCTPLRAERAALWRATSTPVVRTGMGPSRRVDVAGPILVAGVAGAATNQLRPGDLVVASELRTADATVESRAAAMLFGAVARLGLPVTFAPLFSQKRVRDGRTPAADAGAVAVDTESAYLAAQATPGQTVALRAISDTPSAPLLRPGIVWHGLSALRALRAAAPAIDQWAAAVGDREVMLASQPAATLTEWCDLILVLGSKHSPDARRLLDIAEKSGKPAYLVEASGAVDLRWLANARRVGVISGASAPPRLADETLRALSGLGQLAVV